MSDPVLAQSFQRSGEWSGAAGSCTLDYDARFLRRKRLQTDAGDFFLVDLAHTASLEQGDAFVLSNGDLIEVIAAPEPVLLVSGDNLARLAWHIGNRHTPCQILADKLVIRDDPVIAHMLGHLNAICVKDRRPFTPEGGAYGHGRTHSHEHGASAHEH